MTMGITGTIYSSISLCVFNVATFKITFVCMCGGGVSACHDLCDGQRTTCGVRFSPSAVWVPGINSGPSSLAACASS